MDNVIVVNEKDEEIGLMSRKEAHMNGVPHRISVVYVENEQGQILVQIRMSGHLDHSSAGHVDQGESYLEAAKRELQEELGITDVELIELGKGISDEKHPSDGTHRIHVFMLYKCIAEPVELHPEEVKGVYWADPEEIFNEMQYDSDNNYCGGFKESLKIYLGRSN